MSEVKNATSEEVSKFVQHKLQEMKKDVEYLFGGECTIDAFEVPQSIPQDQAPPLRSHDYVDNSNNIFNNDVDSEWEDNEVEVDEDIPALSTLNKSIEGAKQLRNILDDCQFLLIDIQARFGTLN